MSKNYSREAWRVAARKDLVPLLVLPQKNKLPSILFSGTEVLERKVCDVYIRALYRSTDFLTREMNSKMDITNL